MKISKLLALATFALFLAGQSRANAAAVLLLSTDNAAEDTAIKTTLEGLGHTVDIGPHYWSFDGSNLANYEVVLLVTNYNYSSGDMPVAGQTALKSFVMSGGGLVTGEWTVWKRAFDILSPAFPVVGTAAFRTPATITYASVTPDDVLNAGLDPSFTFAADSIAGAETQFVPKTGATTYYSSDYPGGAGVIGWSFGTGRAISFSTVMGPLELGDANYSLLLSNAVTWSTNPQ